MCARTKFQWHDSNAKRMILKKGKEKERKRKAAGTSWNEQNTVENNEWQEENAIRTNGQWTVVDTLNITIIRREQY